MRKIMAVPFGSFGISICANIADTLFSGPEISALQVFGLLALIFGAGCILGIELSDRQPMKKSRSEQ